MRASSPITGYLSVEGVLTYLARPVVVGGILLGVLVARALGPVSLGRVRTTRYALALWVTWAIVGPLALFVLAVISPLAFLSPRYSSSAVPALAGLVGLAIACVRPSQARRIIVGVTALIVLIGVTGTQKFGEEWREAAAFVHDRVDPTTPVLLRAGLVESDQPSWLVDPERSSYLLAPAAAYEFGGDVIPMPYVLDAETQAYFEDLIRDRLGTTDRFLLVTRDRGTGFESWLDGRLEMEGFDGVEIGTFGGVYVVEFSRGSP